MLARELVEAYLEAEKHQEASTLSAELLERDPESAENHFLMGRSEYSLGRYREAKSALEEALRLRPGDESVEQYLDHLSALLGEGANSALKRPIEAVEIPEELLLSLSAPEIEEDYGELGAYYVDRAARLAGEPAASISLGALSRRSGKLSALSVDRLEAGHLGGTGDGLPPRHRGSSGAQSPGERAGRSAGQADR